MFLPHVDDIIYVTVTICYIITILKYCYFFNIYFSFLKLCVPVYMGGQVWVGVFM